MIVCTDCGHQNEDDDDFCGACGAFLEFSGERIEEEAHDDLVEEDEEEERQGIVQRVKEVVGRDGSRGGLPAAGPGEAGDGVEGGGVPGAAVAGAEEVAAEDDPAAAVAEAARRRVEEEAEVAARQAAEAEAEAVAAAAAEEQRRQEEAREAERAEAAAREAAQAERRAEELKARAEAERREAEQAEQAHREAEEAAAEVAARRQEAERAEAAAREAEEARREAERAREEAETARREAEAEAERTRRAAAMVARQTRVEPVVSPEATAAATAAAAGSAAGSAVAAKEGKGRRRGGEPDPGDGAGGAGPSARQPGARQPGAMKPGGAKPRPKPKPTKSQRRPIKPGDLICGQCGEGNDPARNFCRRCGTTLAEAEVAKRPWYERLIPRRRKKEVAAGERPGRQKGRGPGAGVKAKRMGRRIKFAVIGIVAVLAALAVFGPLKDPVNERYQSVKRRFIPEYEQVSPAAAEATSAHPDHHPLLAIDRIRNTFWAEGAPGDGVGEVLTIQFEEPTDLAKVGFHIGSSQNPEDFVAQPRPRTVSILAVGTEAVRRDIDFRDQPEFQDFDLSAEGVTRVEITIEAVFPSLEGSDAAIAEVEFFARK